MNGKKGFAGLIVTIVTVALVFLFMPILQAQTENAATQTTISRLSQLGYWVIPAKASGAGNLITNNIVPFTDSTYHVGEVGNEYLYGAFDRMLVGGENVTRSATFTVASSTSSQQADYVCSGTDDHIQIQAAVDALPAGGGRVLLLEGEYDINVMLDVSNIPGYSKVELCGFGDATIMTTTNISEHFIGTSIITNRNMHIYIHDFVIDGTGQTAGDGINLWGASYTVIENMTIKSTFDDGVEYSADVTWTSVDSKVINCLIYSVGDDGIATTTYVNDVVVDSCSVWSCSGAGVYLLGGGNQVLNSTIYANIGIGISTNGIGDIIANNDVAGNGSQNIYLNQHNCVVIGNQSTGGVSGVYLTATADNTTIVGNHFDSNTYAIYIGGGSTGNTIRGNQGYADENWGTDTIASGSTAKTVTHGCSDNVTRVYVFASENTTADPGHMWADTFGSNTFIVHCANDPGASNLDFNWVAYVR